MNMEFRYDSPKEIRELLDHYGLQMNKRFGQNFLLSRGVRERIVSYLGTDRYDTFWEVGPGVGALTHLIAPVVSSLTLFEIDRGFITILKQLFAQQANCAIVEGDVLKTWPVYRESHPVPDVIFGNLPYNIGAQCIASFIERGCLPDTMVFTLQREVVQRMCANAGSKQYSSFTVLCSLDYHVEYLFDIQPGAFFPVPDVTSAVVSMRRKESSILQGDERKLFMDMVHWLFRSRRKTILNNLSGFSLTATRTKSELSSFLTSHDIDPRLRAENLTVQDMIDLFMLLKRT